MTHNDCKYYLAVDAFKGICKLDKLNYLADDKACDDFEKAKKCMNCSNFTETSDNMGVCSQKYDAYDQMNAITCTEFQWN